jgi:sulfur-oxidizing protein SoxY
MLASTSSFTSAVLGVLLSLTLATPATYAAQDDPLRSHRWPDMQAAYIGAGTMMFDAAVRVSAPQRAEDSLNVPIGVEVALEDVEEILVIADYNPIIKVLQFYPKGLAKPVLSFRMKLQQSSPVRALARTKDGVWHVGGVWVEASGGGCTAPSTGRVKGDWAERLNEVRARIFPQPEQERLKLSIRHPMDTGLAPGIPAFYIEKLTLRAAQGEALFDLLLFEPVSENPVLTFDLANGARGALTLSGVDNNGNKIDQEIAR